jgi:hypothetical protein
MRRRHAYAYSKRPSKRDRLYMVGPGGYYLFILGYCIHTICHYCRSRRIYSNGKQRGRAGLHRQLHNGCDH